MTHDSVSGSSSIDSQSSRVWSLALMSALTAAASAFSAIPRSRGSVYDTRWRAERSCTYLWPSAGPFSKHCPCYCCRGCSRQSSASLLHLPRNTSGMEWNVSTNHVSCGFTWNRTHLSYPTDSLGEVAPFVDVVGCCLLRCSLSSSYLFALWSLSDVRTKILWTAG